MTRAFLTAAGLAIAGALLWFGLDYALPILWPTPAPVAISGGSSTINGASKALALSVFAEPRAIPEIRFADDQGRGLTLGDFHGRVVLLNLWATWCLPCREEMPTLDRLQAKLGGERFLVIPLAVDREGVPAVKRFYRQVGVNHLGIYVDPSGRGSRALAVPGLPTTLLIDQEGREIARKMGAAEWDSAEMVFLIEKTLGRPAARHASPNR
jgi:thiol-disulfide isomerase/thioredoxin